MARPDPKDHLHRYLRQGRDVLVGKLQGLSPYDARRPMTPTATNLLGIVKHLAAVQAGYLGATFGRPFAEPLPWEIEGAADDDDMWARPDESLADIVDLFDRSCTHADATIESLALDAPGTVAWWPEERREVTLHQVLVHLISEVHRHAGQADIVRELIDGTVGLNAPGNNLPERDSTEWAAYRAKVEEAARAATL